MTVANLEAKRQQALKRLDKLKEPERAAEQELAELDEQISQARADEATQRRAQQERDRQLSEARRNIAAAQNIFAHPWIIDPELRRTVPTDDPTIRLARKAIYGAQLLRAAGEDVPDELVIRLKLGD